MRLLLGVVCAVPVLLGSLALPAAAQTNPRWAHTSTLLPNGNILVAGGAFDTAGANGIGNPNPAEVGTEIYLSTDGLRNFYVAAPMNIARASHTATLLPNGKVLVTGGMGAGPTVLDSGEVYDPNTNTWTLVNGGGAMPGGARMNHTATLLPNGNVLIAGGQTTVAGAVTNTCAIYDTVAGNWSGTACTSLGKARAIHTAALLHDGRIMVAGGIEANGAGYAASTEFYSYTANNWTPGPSLIIKRAYHTATVLGNTKVLLAGGFNGREVKGSRGFLDTTEIYDSVSNTMTPGPNMTGRKHLHSALLGPNGSAWITGGFGNVTTSYIVISEPFAPGSFICIDPAGPTYMGGSFITSHAGPPACQTSPSILLTLNLNDPVSGRVIDGELQYNYGSASFEIGVASFTTPGNRSELDAMDVESGVIREYIPFDLPLVGGFESTYQDLEDLGGGELEDPSSINLAVPLDGGESIDIDAGQIRLTFAVGIPDELANSNMYAGRFRIIEAEIERESSDDQAGFDISLDSGTAWLPDVPNGNSCTVAQYDEINGWYYECTLTFTGIEGSLTNTTEQTMPSGNVDLDVVPTAVTAFSVRVQYTPDRMNLTGRTFTTSINPPSPIIIRTMGFSDEAEYIPESNDWMFSTPLDEPIFNHTALLVPNSDRFKIGGRMCQAFPDLPAPGTCSQNIYAALSSGIGQVHIPQFETNETLEVRADIANARSKHKSIRLKNGNILITGGVQAEVPTRFSNIYNPETNTFTNAGELSVARSVHSLNLLPNGTVLAAGGYTSASSTDSTNTVEIFYPETDTWLMTTPMNSSRTFHTSVLLPDGNVFVAGGLADGQALKSAEIYYSTARVWATVAPMDTERAQHTATLLHNGTVFVTGGANVGSILGDSTSSGQTPGRRGGEIYSPATNSWSTVVPPIMNTPRHSHTATLLHDGRVLVAGGDDGFGEIGEAEIYNPIANTWTQTDPTDTGPGNDMIVPRLSHTATLLPNGKVTFMGGFKANGTPIRTIENFDVNFTTFQTQGILNTARGHHTAELVGNEIYVFGGSDGASDLTLTESRTYAVMETNDSLRRALTVRLDTATLQRGGYLSVTGDRFHGRTDASGGSTGRSHHTHPRVYLERIDGSPSGFMVDMTTYVVNSSLFGLANINQKWINANSSITLQMSNEAGITPYGNYTLRVANNALFSEGIQMKIAPAPPIGNTSVPSGTLVGVSSISWTWDGSVVSGHDGYNIYNATTGVWLATAPAAATSWLQRDAGTDNSVLVQVAPYNIGGDGVVMIATIPINTLNANVVYSSGIAQSTSSILWSWTLNTYATSYHIYNATTGAVLASTPAVQFLQVGMATNTVNAIMIQAVTGAGWGPLTGGTSVYTLAAPPLPGTPPVRSNSVSTGGFEISWLLNTNPDATEYVLRYYNDITATTSTVDAISSDEYTLIEQTPNTMYTLSLAAQNGDRVLSNFVSLGSTATLAATPGTPVVDRVTPSSIDISWDASGNPSTTTYQVVYSTDGFSTHFSTIVPFADRYRQTSYSIGNLFTGLTYDIRVSAQNRFGQETAFVSTAAFTDNGGGPIGSLSLIASPTADASIRGNLINGRVIDIFIPAGAFTQSTTLFISTETVLQCGSINAAITITAVPANQPVKPIVIGMSYAAGEVSAGQVGTLSMVRYDDISRSCVPLRSDVDRLARFVYTRLNHLSTFQLASITPATDLSSARIFPNPFYTRNDGIATFDHLPANTHVRIYTLHGARIFEGYTNSSGILTWNGRNNSGRPIASGVYLVMLEGNGLQKVIKMAVVR
ncbi:MAG: kelch repeat-containing protein [Elusimicrobiota bacterium]